MEHFQAKPGVIAVSVLKAVIDTAASGGDEGIVIESFALLAGVVGYVFLE